MQRMVTKRQYGDTQDAPLAAELIERYAVARCHTERLCDPLATEDFVVQSMPEASPIGWHLAHTTWFFEMFVLARHDAGYQTFHGDYQFLYNSYYNSVGEPFPRARRGLLTRPTVAEVFAYRRAVDERVLALLQQRGELPRDVAALIELGINHEQQHQELMLTDIKHAFSCNPLLPAYDTNAAETRPGSALASGWFARDGGCVEIGHAGDAFAFDNERPRHTVFLRPYELQGRLITNGELLEFVRDGGYARPEHWLSMGWEAVRQQGWYAPLYWLQRDGVWLEFSLDGLRPLAPNAPVCHVSYFEADAFARWAGARLPTEAEWEHVAVGPYCDAQPGQLYGTRWQWTASPYAPYPGYATPAGAVGEYNGKFMCNQYVLRGGSFATPAGHVRATYRNFFPPETRWQFTGIRLARDA